MILRNNLNCLELLILQKLHIPLMRSKVTRAFQLKKNYIYLRVLPLYNIQISFRPYVFQILRKKKSIFNILLLKHQVL